jgi:ribonuclease HI
MEIYVDGGCRGNGKPGSIGAAAAVFKLRYGKTKQWFMEMHRHQSPPPTNQRTEIAAIMVALEQALEKYDTLKSYPNLDVKIYSDSKYAIGCMTTWIYKWDRNGWISSAGYEVANRDLIEKASHLDDKVRRLGDVEYIWIPREQNQEADALVNRVMDAMEAKYERNYYDFDDDY